MYENDTTVRELMGLQIEYPVCKNQGGEIFTKIKEAAKIFKCSFGISFDSSNLNWLVGYYIFNKDFEGKIQNKNFSLHPRTL